MNKSPSFCEACQLGKSHALPFRKSELHAEHPLDLIHTDLWGLVPIQSLFVYKYYISFLDDFSRYLWSFLPKVKGDVIIQAF